MLDNIMYIYLIMGLMISLPELISDIRCIIQSRKEDGYEGIIIEVFPLFDWIACIFRFLVLTTLWLVIIEVTLIVNKVKKTD